MTTLFAKIVPGIPSDALAEVGDGVSRHQSGCADTHIPDRAQSRRSRRSTT